MHARVPPRMNQHLLDRLLISRIVPLHLPQHAQAAERRLLLAAGIRERLLGAGDAPGHLL